MTDWRPYPRERVHLPEDGKVTGEFEVTWMGDGVVFVHTDAHVNDDKPAVNYRGESFLFTEHLYRQPDGTFSNSHEGQAYPPHCTRRSNWSDAPPSYAKAIAEAVKKLVTDLWSPEQDRLGTLASVDQELHSLERDRDKAKAELAEVNGKIRKQLRRRAQAS